MLTAFPSRSLPPLRAPRGTLYALPGSKVYDLFLQTVQKWCREAKKAHWRLQGSQMLSSK